LSPALTNPSRPERLSDLFALSGRLPKLQADAVLHGLLDAAGTVSVPCC
jgi:hypothetical protein